ncbi:hypothetical protein A9Q81_15565 [Gammaproteobacteria bacterium 42_54_T18]|nr:hypothetical protein A9Q81_15565 [Gammaproteobacteria bacterium 42_54_T18]
MSIRHVKKILLAIIILILLLISVSNTMKPIRVFVAYYSCRILSYPNILNIDCNKLPTVSVTLPKLTDANSLGAEDPAELDLFFKNHTIGKHIYAHRTNSPKRAKIYKKYYSSFEFDAIWDKKKSAIDIYHWPERKSISFLFSDLLTIMDQDKYYWMDLKNLNNDNYIDIVKYIENMTSEGTKLQKDHLIIESKNPKILSLLEKRNFYTSYYLPDAIFKDNCNDLESVTKIIVNNIEAYPTRYISFPYEQQPYIDHCLLPIIGDIKQLSWGGLPFAIPPGASTRYRAYIVDHSIYTLGSGI